MPDSKLKFIEASMVTVNGAPQTLIVLVLSTVINPQVQNYLEQHMMKCLNPKVTLLNSRPGSSRQRPSLLRRMSVKGAIKKTRSIINDGNFLNYFPT